MKEWIFVAPHFDDVVLSAGGLVWELTHRGDRVEIWTICAGAPPFGKPLPDYARMLHIFFELEGKDVPYERSLEDTACCHVLGASYRRYTMSDCIYRFHPGTDDPLIKLPDDIEGEPEPGESYLIPQVCDFLRKNLSAGAEMVIPLSIGHHRDHVIVRRAADSLGIPLWHYVDYPYVIRQPVDLVEWIPPEAEEYSLAISPEGLKAWQDGIACHRSQIVFFWPDLDAMRIGIEEYCKSSGGFTLRRF